MTSGVSRHPDLLRRFLATPFVFVERDGSSQICIESNELEIALRIRGAAVVQREGRRAGGLSCKIIRDMAAPVGGSEISILSDGPLRVLKRGRGTIVIHDRERSELLGFLASNVKVSELVSSLLPLLFETETEERVEFSAFTNK
jgi:hypothetical protein